MLDDLEAAVRAWAVPDDLKKPRASTDAAGWRDPGPSRWSLTFDTETTIGVSQRLRVIAYQVHYDDELREAGLAYDPAAISEAERATVEAYAEANGLVCGTHREFIVKVFMPIAAKGRSLVIGHNLPYDVSRIASGHGRIGGGDRRMHGGVSFAFPGTEQRVQVKRNGPRSAFIRLALPEGSSEEKRNRAAGGDLADHRGYFVDTATIGGTLFGRKLPLKRLAELLGTEHRKTEADLGGTVTRGLLAYATTDVQVTWECYVALRDRYAALGLAKTPLWHIHSEAGIGKANLREMNLRPWRTQQPNFPAGVLAAILETYYGGRVECGVRAMSVPGVLVDFASQYPTVSTLMGLWRYHVASGIAALEEDPASVQAMLDAVSVERVLEREFWPTLDAIVLVDPAGTRLPTRAQFQGHGRTKARARAKTRNVALAVHRGHLAQWWTLADAVSSVLETGRAPRVLRVLRFRPRDAQPDLHAIDVAGGPAYRVNPYREDFIRRLVELRAAMRHEAKEAKAAGDATRALELDGRAAATKKAANSIAYGAPIEVNVTDYAMTVGVTVYRPDGSVFRPADVHRSEEPGEWFHPLLATLVVAGGRLLLAAAMRLVHDAAGTYAFCDTDGLFVVATEDGGLVAPRGLAAGRSDLAPVPALSWAQVDAIAGRFAALNPFDLKAVWGSILEVKDVNYDPETGERRELWCFSIAAKRYALFTIAPDGRPSIARSPDERYRSEHALGHLLSPLGRDPEGRWVDRWWEHLLCLELEIPDPVPDWFGAPAVGALTITSAQDERAFAAYNAARPYAERVRPWGFLMTAHVHPFARLGRGPRVLVAPREDDPGGRRDAAWFDRADPGGEVLRIRTGDPTFVVPGTVTVQSYGDYFEEFRRHPESKAAGPDGEPCHPWTRGQLGPLEVTVRRLVRIGKEAGRLASDPTSGEATEFVAQEYRESACAGCGRPIAQNRRWCGEACRKRAERRRIVQARKCGWCGVVLADGMRKWCSDVCRKRAQRQPGGPIATMER